MLLFFIIKEDERNTHVDNIFLSFLFTMIIGDFGKKGSTFSKIRQHTFYSESPAIIFHISISGKQRSTVDAKAMLPQRVLTVASHGRTHLQGIERHTKAKDHPAHSGTGGTTTVGAGRADSATVPPRENTTLDSHTSYPLQWKLQKTVL